MSFDALLKEVEALGDDERRKLLRFMITMEDRTNKWPVPPPAVPQEELRRIHALIESEFSQVDAER